MFKHKKGLPTGLNTQLTFVVAFYKKILFTIFFLQILRPAGVNGRIGIQGDGVVYNRVEIIYGNRILYLSSDIFIPDKKDFLIMKNSQR